MVVAWIWQVINDAFDVRALFLSLPIPIKVASYCAATYLILLFNTDAPKSFIYFRF
jgi:hypothetical protein